MLARPSSRRPVLRLVELVGPPGAGKTTLARAALAAGRDRGSGWIDARLLARRPRLGSAPSGRLLAAASRRPGLATALLGAPDEATVAAALDAAAPTLAPLLARAGRGTSVGDDVLRGLVLRWGMEALAVRALVDAARRHLPATAVAVLDEGLTHPYKLAAFGDPEPAPDLLAVLPLPDVLVRVDLPDAELRERLRRRRDAAPTTPRARTWTPDAALTAEVGRLRRAVDAVTVEAERRGVPVVTVDGVGAPRTVAADLVARVDAVSGGTA